MRHPGEQGPKMSRSTNDSLMAGTTIADERGLSMAKYGVSEHDLLSSVEYPDTARVFRRMLFVELTVSLIANLLAVGAIVWLTVQGWYDPRTDSMPAMAYVITFVVAAVVGVAVSISALQLVRRAYASQRRTAENQYRALRLQAVLQEEA